MKDNKIKEFVELACMVCGETFMGPEPKMCCSGRDCGCMGMPIDPIVCSEECYNNLPGIKLRAKGGAGIMNKELTKKIEIASLEIVHEMSIESLPPDLFEQWESVRSALLETRKAFKKKDIKGISDEDAQQIGYDNAQSFLDANKDYPNGVGVLSAESFNYLLRAGYHL